MSDQYPPPPADGVPPNTGQVPPNYAAPVPPQYGTSAQPPYGSPAQPPYGSPAQPHFGANELPFTTTAPLDDAQTRQWAGLAHLGGILGFVPALVIWLVFRERSAFVDQEAKKALNFQITVLIGYAASVVLGSFPFIGGLSGLITLAIWVTALVFSIQGYQAVQRGQAYVYPFTLDLIK